MSIVIGADAAGLRLKDLVKEFLVKENFDVVDVTAEGQDFVDVTLAEVSDERSAYMTRGHNNSRMITMGAEIVGDELAKNIAKGFVNGKYDGGRHQIRVDMLNKMC